MYFCKNENFAYGEINERSFSTPTPSQVMACGRTGDKQLDQPPLAPICDPYGLSYWSEINITLA